MIMKYGTLFIISFIIFFPLDNSRGEEGMFAAIISSLKFCNITVILLTYSRFLVISMTFSRTLLANNKSLLKLLLIEHQRHKLTIKC